MGEKKENRKHMENVILETVKEYKVLLCQQIKSGRNLHQEGLLFDMNSTYSKVWKTSLTENLTPEERKIYRINFCLASLDKQEAEIIWKEFFFMEERFYWMRKYNRSTYYRIRNRAMKNFYNLIR